MWPACHPWCGLMAFLMVGQMPSAICAAGCATVPPPNPSYAYTPHTAVCATVPTPHPSYAYIPHTAGLQLSSYPIHLMDTPHTQPGVHATVPPPHLSYTYTPQTAGCATVLLPHPSIIKISHQRTLFKIEN
jgi:hypothetical protein